MPTLFSFSIQSPFCENDRLRKEKYLYYKTIEPTNVYLWENRSKCSSKSELERSARENQQRI